MAIQGSPSVFIGTFVACPQPGEVKIFNNHILKLDENGFISSFLPQESDKGRELLNGLPSDTLRTYLPSSSFMLPTFCDLHLHAPQMLYLGTGLHLPLLEWLEHYAYKAEERIENDPDLASRVYSRLARRLIENGTGAVLLFGTIRTESNLLLARIFQEAGIRAFVGKLSMDISTRPNYVEPSATQAIESAREFIDKCKALVSHLPAHEQRVRPVITPRFVPTCSSDLLARLGSLAEETSTMVQSHMAEARDQIEWVRQNRGADDIDVFAQSHLLTPKTIQAHCTFLTPQSLQQLHSTGAGVAHCPLSNAYFSSRQFPLREALDMGLKVGLGTDIAGGYDVDIMSSMRMAVIISKLREGDRVEKGLGSGGDGRTSVEVSWTEALYLATTGGAIALGLQVGEHPFQVGLPFDVQQIDLYDEQRGEGIGKVDFFDSPLDSISIEMVEKWWCMGNRQNRSAMYIQGHRVL